MFKMHPLAKPNAALLKFATEAYKNFDESHNLEHGLAVWENAKEIMSERYPDVSMEEWIEMCYITVLHDTVDRKYIDTGLGITMTQLEEFLVGQLGQESGLKCFHVINNMSWSKEQAQKNIPLPEDDWMRQYAQDADWLEAIGDVGLRRCIAFTTERSPGSKFISDDVCLHIRQKLLKIPGALHTNVARKMAKDKLDPLLRYLQLWEK